MTPQNATGDPVSIEESPLTSVHVINTLLTIATLAEIIALLNGRLFREIIPEVLLNFSLLRRFPISVINLLTTLLVLFINSILSVLPFLVS